jgi:hypothetical protein
MSSLDAGISAQLKKIGVLEARIPPAASSAGLRVALALGALFAALFPLTYVALMPLAAGAIYWLAKSRAQSPMLSAAVLLAGCLLILSLLKPLVAPPSPAPEPHYLNPKKQPLLFAMVRSLASGIGVAAPERIAVDCDVNCYSMFAGGRSGVFRSGYVLTIGLPLVTGLRLDQLVGVLSHELGHALEITTMRSSRLIWVAHSWLSRVATQRDQFDLMLRRRLGCAGSAARPLWHLILWLAQPGRGILWLFMILEGAVTSALRRHIEIGADRYQIRTSGSDRFVSAVLDINLLTVAAQRATVELARMKRAGRLIDDYPGLVTYIRAQYSKDFVQRLLSGLEEERTGFLSAHPCDKDRIAMARSEQRQGIVTADLPASVLFADFQALCREVTVEYYKQEFGITAEGCKFVPIETILKA